MKKALDPINVYVGQRLRRARASRGFSQAKLGKLESLTLHQVSKYEKGVSALSIGRLISLARHLGYPTTWFYEKFYKKERREISRDRI